MTITVQLPDDISTHSDPGREALEVLVIEGYRSEALSHYQASQMLGMTEYDFEGFLKEREIYDHSYSIEQVENDFATFERLKARGFFDR